VIERPSFFQLLLACYGISPFFMIILRSVVHLTESSMYNLKQCDYGDLDFVFIEFLAKEAESAEISSHGLNIQLVIDFKTQREIVIPLSVAMASTHSSYSLTSRLLDYCFQKSNRILRLLGIILSKCSSFPCDIWPIFAFSHNSPIQGLQSHHLNQTFSLTFWYRVDSSICQAASVSLDIIRFFDHKQTLTISSLGDLFVIKSDRNRLRTFVETICSIPPNQWCFIALIFRYF
jgi:hypothetical protein